MIISDCYAGEYYDTDIGSCQKCGLGYYSKRASTICTPCAIGSYANQLGSTACMVCPIGWTTSQKASVSCDVCADGYKNLNGNCIARCMAGTYFNGTECVACPVGTFSGEGATTCTACPTGSTTAGSGATYCDVCTDGYHMEDNECVKDSTITPEVVCEPGYEPSYSGTTCEICEKGYYSNSGQYCSSCPTGSSTVGKGAISEAECTVCLNGYHMVEGVCQPYCNAGYYWDGEICQACAAGHYSLQGSTSCSACAAGRYQPNPGQSSCLSCPTGSTTEGTGSTTIESCNICQSGYIMQDGVCTPCPAGSYAAFGDTSCTLCPVGKYQGYTGSSSCYSCPKGRTTLTEGATSCVCDTENGFVAVGDECILVEYSCGAGHFYDSDTKECKACEAGTFSSSGETYCTACPYGYFADKEGSVICQQCPTGWTTSANKATSCDVCADGYEMQNGQCILSCPAGQVFNGTACEDCPVGYFSAKGDSTCQVCPRGYSTSHTGSYQCDVCADDYVDRDGACIPKAESCHSGEYWDKSTMACANCPAGSYSHEGSSICTLCEQGEYAPYEGSSYCSSCPRGSTTSIVGATSSEQCNVCAVGYSWNDTEKRCVMTCVDGQFWDGSACVNCPAGSYTKNIGYENHVPTSCTKCAAGSYATSEGSTSCTSCPYPATSPVGSTSAADCSCPNGYHDDGTGSGVVHCVPSCEAGSFWTGTECQLCAAGTYSGWAGRTSCASCWYGEYSEEGATGCLSCPTGWTTSTTGSPTCDICANGYELQGTECVQCEAGSYSGVFWGSSESPICTLCPKGEYSSSKGSTSCNSCPTGYTTAGEGSISQDECTECAEGYKEKDGKCVRVDACEAGSYWNGTECALCSAGTFSLEGSKKCFSCPLGTYTSETGATTCNACPEGYITAGVGSVSETACSLCADGYRADSTGACVRYSVTCPDGKYYNGFECVDVPENAQSDSSDARGWTCQDGYTRVGKSCILTSSLEALVNPEGETLAEGMEYPSLIDGSKESILINNGVIDLGETDSSVTGMDAGSGHAVNNGIIQNTNATNSVTGMRGSGILDNNGTIDLTGSSMLRGMSGTLWGEGNLFNYNTIKLTANGGSAYGMDASYSDIENYGDIVIHGKNTSELEGISHSNYWSSKQALNYGNIEIFSFEGNSILGAEYTDNYGNIKIHDYQNSGTSPSRYGLSNGKNYGRIYMDVQGSQNVHSVYGLYDGFNYGPIDIYAKDNKKNLDIYGLKNSHNMGMIQITSENNGKIIGMEDKDNYGTVKIESADTTNVRGINYSNDYNTSNYGQVEVVAAGSDSVYGMRTYDGRNFGHVNVTSIGYNTTATYGLYQADNHGSVYVSASGNNLRFDPEMPDSYYGNKGYGVYGADNYGEISVTGSADVVYGLYSGDNHVGATINLDASKTSLGYALYEGNNAGIINVINQGSSNEAHGISKRYGTIVNEEQGTINVNNIGAGTAYGIYVWYGTIKNYGKINVVNSANGNAYGIYGRGATIENYGTIDVTSGVGIYAKGGSVHNAGTIIVDGDSMTGNTADGSHIVLDGGWFENSGLLASTSTLNLSSFGGDVVAMPQSVISSPVSINDSLHISSALVADGFKSVYTGSNMIQTPDSTGLKLISDSALFDAKLADNGSDVIMTKKPFSDLTQNSSLSRFLEKNYRLGYNESFFNELKSISTAASFRSGLNRLTGENKINRFTREDLTVLREVNLALNENMFANEGKTIFSDKGNINNFSFRNNQFSNAQYALANRRISPNVKVGYAMMFSHINTNDKADDNSRNTAIYQLAIPINYRRAGFSLISTPMVGFARGHYNRSGFNDTSYRGIIEKRLVGLMNEVRYPIHRNAVEIAPTVELNAIAYNQKGNEDNKEYALTIPSDNRISVEGGIGLHLKRIYQINKTAKLNLVAGMMGYYEFADPYDIKLGMQGMHGTFNLYEDNPKRYRGVGSLGFNYEEDDFTFYGQIRHYIENEVHTDVRTGLKFNF